MTRRHRGRADVIACLALVLTIGSPAVAQGTHMLHRMPVVPADLLIRPIAFGLALVSLTTPRRRRRLTRSGWTGRVDASVVHARGDRHGCPRRWRLGARRTTGEADGRSRPGVRESTLCSRPRRCTRWRPREGSARVLDCGAAWAGGRRSAAACRREKALAATAVTHRAGGAGRPGEQVSPSCTPVRKRELHTS